MHLTLGLLFALCGIACGSLIKDLPFAPPVNFKQYSGYFSVGKENKHLLHYWFVESQRDPARDPLILWLTGGPGCSGLMALLTEWGPYNVNPTPQGKNWTLSANPYSWNKIANVLTIESPVGVGYSYSLDGNVATDDRQTADENFEALRSFLTQFPRFRIHDFYVAGESYGGVYVPTLVETILDRKSEFAINLKGFLIGNGCVSSSLETDTLMEFCYTHGLINDRTWDAVRDQCCNGSTHSCSFSKFTGNNFCSNFVAQTVDTVWLSNINPYGMYADCLSNEDAIQKRYAHDAYLKTGVRPKEKKVVVPCIDDRPVYSYLNQPAVREALFIPTSLPMWDICSDAVTGSYSAIYPEMGSRVKKAINAGVRALLYHGDTDLACNALLGQRFSCELAYPLTSPKEKFVVDGQVGGFHTQYGLLEFETIRGAGHMVPTDKPSVALHILDSFLNQRKP